MRSRIASMIVLTLFVSGWLTIAEALDIPANKPEIFSACITIDYNATTDAFSVQGIAVKYYSRDGSEHDIANGDFGLEAIIDEDGNASPAGSLQIQGDMTGSGVVDLLTADNITDFGYVPVDEAGCPRFEFIMDIAGGSLAPAFLQVGPQVGVILSGFNNLPSPFSWQGSFHQDYKDILVVCDTVATPEAGSAWMMLITVLLVAAAAVYRRQIVCRSTEGLTGQA